MCAVTSWAPRSLNRTMPADPWPRIGDSMPRPRSSQDRATKATDQDQKQNPKPPARGERKQLVGKAPLGSLPAKKGRSAASPFPEFIAFATCLMVDRPPDGPEWV